MKEFNLNNLPKYWVVKLDKETNLHPFFQNFLKILNGYQSYRPQLWIGSATSYYYGYDGNEYYGGTNCWEELKHFKNNPVVLTMDEFQRLVTKVGAYNINYLIF